jgi:hypothetical protein
MRTLAVTLLATLGVAAAAHGSEFPRLKVGDLPSGKVEVVMSGVFEDLVWADPATLLAVDAPDDENRPYDLVRLQPGSGTGAPLREPMPREVGTVVFAPDASGYLAVHGVRDGIAVVLHNMDGSVRAQLFSFEEQEAVFLAMSWSRTARHVALSTTERVVVLDATTAMKVVEVPVGRDNGNGPPAFSPDERAIVAFDRMRLVHVDLATGATRRLAKRRYYRVAWSAAGHLAAIRPGGPIDLVSPVTGRPVRPRVGRLKAWTMTWSPDGNRLAFSFSRYDGYDGVGVYDVARDRLRAIHKPIFNTIGFLRWSPDGRRLAWYAGW